MMTSKILICLIGHGFNGAGDTLGTISFAPITSMPSKNAPRLDDYHKVTLIHSNNSLRADEYNNILIPRHPSEH